ncbi:TPA: hypothetical protein JBH79_15470 [Legionella pneumophila]|nr:hypothetical protein [Legionella pneumophila]
MKIKTLLFLLFFSALFSQIVGASTIYTGNDYITLCNDYKYRANKELCDTAIVQAFSVYLASIELFGGEKKASCYRSFYPFLEKSTGDHAFKFLNNSYKKSPNLRKELLGFGFSVAILTAYPMPKFCEN